MKTILSWAFLIGLFVLMYFSPIHAIAGCLILLLFIFGSMWSSVQNIEKAYMILGVKAAKELNALEALNELNKAMNKYGFEKKPAKPMSGGDS